MAFWSRFSSRDAQDITTHFTPEEAAAYHELAQKEGGRFGATIAGPGSVVTVVLANSTAREFPHASSLAILEIFTVIFLAVAYFRSRPLHYRLRAFLCSTHYARLVGYRAEALHLSRFGLY